MTHVLEKNLENPKQKLAQLVREGQKMSSLQVERLPVKDYEQVLKISDKQSGLLAIIAIHDTTLGPALGGVRIRPYETFQAALEDVLRLSKGMTYKSAISDVGFGGGKSVILADPKKGQKTPEMLRAFGAAVEQLTGAYICAEDVGCTTDDVKLIRQNTQYVVGLTHEKSSGDPGPFTAWGTFRGIQATVKQIYGSDSLEGKTVAVQGLGNVGAVLCDYLFWAGAHLILADIDEAKAERLARKYGGKTVPVDQILQVQCDILAPCALGAIINDETICTLQCRGIAGCANNQLLRDSHGFMLKEKGILYAPDFVINAGGLLNVSAELEETGYVPSWSRDKIHRIYDTLLAIYEIAERNGESTHNAACALADYRIKYQIGKRFYPPVFHHTVE
jgi:leucine dehydrogenase